MTIAVIGAGNVGGALARAWSLAGHEVLIGARNAASPKVAALVESTPALTVRSIAEAVSESDVILLAVPAMQVRDVIDAAGALDGKVLIDAMNAVRTSVGEFTGTFEALRAWAPGADVVKCFNSTGYNVMADPVFGEARADMFMAGGSDRSKSIARQLASDAGFAECHDAGGDEAVPLVENLAMLWITMAMFRGQGRDIAFKLMKR